MAERNKKKGRIREQIDAFAIAILMAVLMKYFAIEAYQIPTSSMQPTMMGSKSSGVYDRILVDKARYLFFEPQRWEIAVFRYPIRIQQSYVKRIAGLPDETLRIAGGNLYLVHGNDPNDPAQLSPLPRPTGVQEEHWKEIFPARAILHAEQKTLGIAFQGLGGDWSEGEGRRLTVKQRSGNARSSIVYADVASSGISNRVYDGYPTWIAQKMIEAGESEPAEPFTHSLHSEQVQDVRAAFDVTPRADLAELETSLRVAPLEGAILEFALVTGEGKGRIVVRSDGKEVESSPAFDAPMSAGRTVHVRFAHVDDRCIAELDGHRVAELDCTKYKTLSRLLPSDSVPDRGRVTLRFAVRGGEEVTLDDIKVERDLHYVPTLMSTSAGADVIRVPSGHYFMLGDNTLQSVDSRDWTAITLGMDAEGRLIDPEAHPDLAVRKLRGNLRAVPPGREVDPDENPVVVQTDHKIVFTDDLGEVWTLDGEIAMSPSSGHVYDGSTPWVMDAEHRPWLPRQSKVQFVPREHIIGRPLLTFWPGFHPFRIGFIR